VPQRSLVAPRAELGRAGAGPCGLLVSIGALILALCGCPAPRTDVTFALAILPSELPAYRVILDEFERNSGLKVTAIAQQYADIRRAVHAEAVAGRGTLDLVELDVYALSIAASDVRVLSPEAFASELAAITPQAADAGRIDGLRFLPHRVSWQALIYDHSVLGRPPATWAELLDVAERHPGRVALKGALYEGLTCDLLTFVWAAGGTGAAFDDQGARTAFEFLSRLAPYLHPQSAVFKEATIAEAMARGELVLHINWPFAMSLYAAQGLAPERIRSAALPHGPVNRTTVLGGGYLGVPRGAPHPESAERLARFLLSRPTQERLQEALGWFSARADVTLGGDGTNLAGFAAMRESVRPRPEERDYALLSRLWQQAGRAVLFEHAAPDVALEHAARAHAQTSAPEAAAVP
jgi:ABC-type glycerol-3-phosphate transport system substrate-binding protein